MDSAKAEYEYPICGPSISRPRLSRPKMSQPVLSGHQLGGPWLIQPRLAEFSQPRLSGPWDGKSQHK